MLQPPPPAHSAYAQMFNTQRVSDGSPEFGNGSNHSSSHDFGVHPFDEGSDQDEQEEPGSAFQLHKIAF